MLNLRIVLSFYVIFALFRDEDFSSASTVPKLDDSSISVIQQFVQGVNLTFGRLLKGSDVYGPIEKEVTFWCINRKTNTIVQTIVNDPDVDTKLDKTKPLYIVTHGWLEFVKKKWVQDILLDLITYFDVNACGVDWQKLANYEYAITALEHVPKVGDYIAEFVEYSNKLGIGLSDVTLVGHSLGGQISGRAGLKVHQKLGSKVSKIFGLDPAGPLFCFPVVRDLDNRLDSSDAEFVQNIHTTDGLLGCGLDHGHQDFRPNGGTIPQLPCIIASVADTETTSVIAIVCGHGQSVIYFRYSLNVANLFTGYRCSGYYYYNFGFCNGNPTDLLGPHTNQRPGNFYLNTGFFPPFAR